MKILSPTIRPGKIKSLMTQPTPHYQLSDQQVTDYLPQQISDIKPVRSQQRTPTRKFFSKAETATNSQRITQSQRNTNLGNSTTTYGSLI